MAKMRAALAGTYKLPWFEPRSRWQGPWPFQVAERAIESTTMAWLSRGLPAQNAAVLLFGVYAILVAGVKASPFACAYRSIHRINLSQDSKPVSITRATI